MTTRSEDVLYASLTDIEALERVAKIGLRIDSIPTEELRPMVEWALDEYFRSGRKQAPSREMLIEVWGETLEDLEVELIDESVEIDTIESALDALKDHHALREFQTFVKDASTRMATAGVTQKVETLTEVTNELFHLTSSLQDQSSRTTADVGYVEALVRYQVRAAEEVTTRGMTFGLEAIDRHTYGIHPGELAVLAGGPKIGKSMALVRIALHEWAVRSRIVALFSLENTVDMTMDRLVCFHLGLDPTGWQRGELPEQAAVRVQEFIHDQMPAMPGTLHVIQSPRGSRTPEMMIREARLLGAESVLIDQLTHVEHHDPGRKARNELFNENVHEFADLAQDSRDAISILLAHQINRSGVEASKKQNYLEMHHMAESAGVERAASWVFGVHQALTERTHGTAKFQTLAARREDINNWSVSWNPRLSTWRVLGEIELGAA